ncbi:ATP-dependent DNA helicase PIF1 [Trichonephila clavipes]|uniref:ATP-dependent DNA helicase n=1 Tax=Trichonephila clavipes TaxID=2585209 RepID=A0A8X6SVF7_TRICX|nr:ATP-dependent DNA helicase PIF1 [Trichonephila clavipes]
MPILTGNYLRLMRQQWQQIEFLFIDEISMVQYEMLYMVDSQLKQLKNKELLFDGINICVFGDLMQLPPVRGNQVFDQPSRFVPATYLWRSFSLIELNENMRQQGSTTFKDLLNALRIGELQSEHLAILMNRLNKEPTGEFAIEKALRRLYSKSDSIDLNNITPSDINKTGGLPKKLEIFVVAKVMLRYNVDASKGLVNGAIRHITGIIWSCFRRAQMYVTDIPSVHIDFGKDGVHLIQPKTAVSSKI